MSTPMTSGDLSLLRRMRTGSTTPVTAGPDDEAGAANVARWVDGQWQDLVTSSQAKRVEGERLLAEADEEAAVWPILVQLGALRISAAVAVTTVEAATARVVEAEAALVKPDAAIAECRRRHHDVEAAGLLATAADEPDLSHVKALRDDAAA